MEGCVSFFSECNILRVMMVACYVHGCLLEYWNFAIVRGLKLRPYKESFIRIIHVGNVIITEGNIF